MKEEELLSIFNILKDMNFKTFRTIMDKISKYERNVDFRIGQFDDFNNEKINFILRHPDFVKELIKLQGGNNE